MEEAPQYIFFEQAVGYVLFRVKEFEDIGMLSLEVRRAINDAQRFQSVVQIHAFESFKDTEAALNNMKDVSEGSVSDDLLDFLESNLPKKRKKFLLGLGDGKLATSIHEKTEIRCTYTGVALEVLRGIRFHFDQLIKGLPHHSLVKSQLALAHSYSRSKVKFDIHRVDNMIIQSIAILDQLDKDINLFGMRIREWYSYHFPELYRIVPDLYNYVRCTLIIMDRENIDEDVIQKLSEIFPENLETVNKILEASRTSIGMEITNMDLDNIKQFAKRVASLAEYRIRLNDYLKNRMDSCAPSLSALIGEQVGARLISRAGSLTNLAKNPASTLQILGAEKSLFRAIKTKSNTPKYGLIFHSSFIGRASGKNKGRISRFLANKCSIATRIDCFADVPVATYGEYLRGQVEDRLKYYEEGKLQSKNTEVMKTAMDEAAVVQKKILKKIKKAAKRKAKEELPEPTECGDVEMAEAEV